MDFKKTAAVLVAAAIFGTASFATVNTFLSDNVVSVSAATSLRKNSTGSEVKQLQQNLITLRYLGSGGATGTYDDATEKAVRSFQTDYRLTVDGVAGTQTINMINSLVNGSVRTLEVKATLLNVREKASPSGKLVTTVKQGQKFTIEGEASESDGTKWYKITTKVGSGYVCSDYVEVTAASNQTQIAQNGTLKVTGTVLNVRSEASTSSAKLATLKEGQTFSYTAAKMVDGEMWYYIKVNSSVSGWVLGKWVNASGSSSTTVKNGVLKVVVDILNVRQSASTSSKKLYTLKLGQTYYYSDVKTVGNVKWYYIKVNASVSGWVLGSMVSATPNTPTTTTANTTTTTATTTTTTTQSSDRNSGNVTIEANVLNVRSEANTSSKVVTTVKKGKSYRYSSVKTVNGEKWYHIAVNSSTNGWVCGSYVKVSASSATTENTSSTMTTTETAPSTTSTEAPKDATGKLTVQAELLNVRDEAGSQGEIVTTVKKGQSFTYSQTQQIGDVKWYFIQLSSSRSGWVMGTYVKAEQEVIHNVENKEGTLTVIGASVNIRSGAGTTFDKVALAKKGEKYKFTAIDSNWYCVELSGGKTGWLIGTYVKVDEAAQTTTTTASTTTTSTTTSTTTTTTTTTTTSTATTGETKVTVPEPSGTDEPTTDSPSTTSSATPSTDPTTPVNRNVTVGTVNVSGTLNVRKGAGTNYATIGSLKGGTQVVIVSKGKTWHKIEFNSGYGYVNASYITNIIDAQKTVEISYTAAYTYIQPGQNANMSISVNDATVRYSSSDPENCPVSANGIATGKKEGLYEITARCGNSATAAYVVVMAQPNANVATMKISERGTQFIADWEGGDTVLPNGESVFYPYKDVSGYWTIGFGHAKTTTASKSWSETRAIEEFNKDIEQMIGPEYLLTSERPFLTLEAAKLLLNADLNDGEYVRAVSNWAVRNGVELNQYQFDALVSFCYNLGPSLWDSDSTKFYLKSAILAFRSGDKADPGQIIEGFCRYYKSSGKAYKGLWYRRRNEAELFLTGDYSVDRANKFQLPSNISWS